MMDYKDDQFKMYPEPIGLVLTGTKEWKSDIWRIKRIKGKRTWLNWFPEDEFEISTDYLMMRGGEELIDAAVLSGVMLEWVKD